jgi:DNA-3-methyladenine glycosylase
VAVTSELSDFLSGEVVDVARRLLGARFVTTFGGEETSVRLVEVEAYAGSRDPASHAYRGETRRNHSMFGPAGTLYVYRSYGIHWCMNVVAEEPGHAVLLRGGQILHGGDVIKRRRDRTDHLTDGPGKLCQALGVTGDCDGASLDEEPVRLVPDVLSPEFVVRATPRVGITKAADRPWRFMASNS